MTTRRQMALIAGVFGSLICAALAALPTPFSIIACIALAGPIAAGLRGMRRPRGTAVREAPV